MTVQQKWLRRQSCQKNLDDRLELTSQSSKRSLTKEILFENTDGARTDEALTDEPLELEEETQEQPAADDSDPFGDLGDDADFGEMDEDDPFAEGF